MACQCHQIGGPWIAEDPSCPIHGQGSVGREQRIEIVLERFRDEEIGLEDAIELIMELLVG